MAKGLGETADTALQIFHTLDEGEPNLVDIGIPEVRSHIGGMFKGNLVGVAGAQNVGKSSFLRTMGMLSTSKGGILSTEDGEDVWGSRLLAAEADVKPTKIRRKDLTSDEIERLKTARDTLHKRDSDGLGPVIEYRIGASLDGMQKGVEELAKHGVAWVALDYLQKIKGTGAANRHNEVSNTLTTFQRVCEASGIVPVIFSQLHRLEPGKEPYPHHLKESGDIENECRLIIMLWRDAANNLIVRCKVAKSTFGGSGVRFAYRYHPESEALLPMYEEEEDF